jgi:hypothetical protein
MAMSDDDLLSQIKHEEGQALGYFTGDLSREREKALDYYQGNPDVTAPEGRSTSSRPTCAMRWTGCCRICSTCSSRPMTW